MRTMRPAVAANPKYFGRKIFLHAGEPAAASAASEDFKLFATTFAAGFLFVSMLLA